MVHVSFGFDGCGSHRPYSGFAFIGAGINTGNLIYGGVNVTMIEVHPDDRDVPGKAQVLWKAKSVASVLGERPYFLVDGIEKYDKLRPIMNIITADVKEWKENQKTKKRSKTASMAPMVIRCGILGNPIRTDIV